MFGATVELEEESSGEVVKYQIVGEDEADLKLGLINISSPIARARASTFGNNKSVHDGVWTDGSVPARIN